MSKSQPPVTITGQATCVVGLKAGHDGDECRANALSNGGILCVVCGASYPAAIARLFEAARTMDLRVTNMQHGSTIRRDTPVRQDQADNPHVLHISPYDAACLSGHDPAQFEQTRLTLALPDSVEGSIRYTAEDANAAAEPTNNFGRAFEGNEFPSIPASATAFARLLADNQFVVTGAIDDRGFCTLKLARGHAIVGSKIIEDPAGGRGRPVPDPEKLCIFGISVELQWRA